MAEILGYQYAGQPRDPGFVYTMPEGWRSGDLPATHAMSVCVEMDADATVHAVKLVNGWHTLSTVHRVLTAGQTAVMAFVIKLSNGPEMTAEIASRYQRVW